MTEQDRLRGASVDGVAVNLASQLLRFGLRFTYQIVIARLLLPADFGLVALIAPVMTFISLFADLGLSQATIQHENISEEQLSFLFWVNVAAGTALAAFCVAAAPLVAHFYGDPRVDGVMIASGALLFIGGFYGQHMALLNRRMRFRALAALDLSGFGFGAVCAIAAAKAGAGYWAILANQAGVSVVTLAGAWWLAAWRPGRPGRLSDMRPLLHFGGNVTSFNFVNFFSRNSDNILIGRFAGEAALGLYDRAFKLMLLPFEQVAAPFSKVAVPLLSRSQSDPVFYRRAFRRMLQAVLLLVYPGLAFMIANSHPLVVLGLGQRWAGVAPIFAILGVDAFVAPIGNSMGWLFVSQGRTKEMRDWGIAASIMFVGCFVAGLHWGPRGVAAGYATAGLLEILVLSRVGTRSGPLRTQDFWPMLTPFMVAAAVDFAVLECLPAAAQSIPGLVLQVPLSYGLFVGSLAMFHEGRQALSDAVRQARQLRGRLRRPRDDRRVVTPAEPVPVNFG